jgi:hypothetical protein
MEAPMMITTELRQVIEQDERLNQYRVDLGLHRERYEPLLALM